MSVSLKNDVRRELARALARGMPVRNCLGTIAAASLLVCGPAPAEEAEKTEELEEIVVTGTAGGAAISKLDASFAISTVSAQEISRTAPTSTADLFKTVPGIWVESSSGVSGANIMVRGLPGTSDADWVTIEVDGAPLYPPGTVSFLENSTLFRIDETIERMESLRGGPNPVHGNGQPGLTANFILKEGSEETAGKLKYTTSDYDLRRVDGVLSGKISDGFYYMMGGYLSSSPGIRDAGFNAEEGQQFTLNLTREFAGGKAKLFHRTTDDHGTWYLPVDRGNPAIDAGYTQVGPLNRQQIIQYRVPAIGGGSEQRRETVDMGEGRGWIGSITGGSVEFELGGGITFTDRMSLTKGDADTVGFVPTNFSVALNTLRDVNGNLLTGGTGATTGRSIPGTTLVQLFGPWAVRKDIKAFINDLSLAKAWEDTAKVTVGYYSSSFSVDEHWAIGGDKWFEHRHNGEMINEVACARGDTNGDGDALDPGEADLVPQAQTDTCAGNFDLDANGKATWDGLYAAGEITFGPVTLDAGVRSSKSTTKYTNDANILNGTVDQWADEKESKNSYTVAANWSINDNMGVFVRANSGYLFPDFDTYRNFQPQLHTLGLDLFRKVKQYELGYKLSTGMLSVYATYFRNEVAGSPSGCVVGGSGPCVLQENEAQGIELDANVLLAGGFALDVNATWQDTEITNGPNIGNEVGRQPPYQLRISPSYYLQFGDGFDGTIYATYSKIDERFDNDPNTVTVPGFDKVDLGVLVNFSNLEFQVAVDNLTDEEGLTEGDPRNPTSQRNARFIMPRNIKFSVGYNF